ncbi:Transposase [Planctomycetales bacterium 10988]|nr:Transposase [Planctomycetales bacterium 10988]
MAEENTAAFAPIKPRGSKSWRGERPSQKAFGGSGTRQGNPAGGGLGKLLTPAKRCRAVRHVREALGRSEVSERRACRVLRQPRSTQRRVPRVRTDEPRLVHAMVRLVTQYGRYGYRRITAMLRREGWQVNHKRINLRSFSGGMH